MTPTRQDMIVTRWGARFHGRSIPCAVGRGGITSGKREGDGATPAGIWHIVAGLYRADRMTRPETQLPLRPVGPLDIWSDDARDPFYNHGLRAFDHPFSHESLRRADPLYDLVLLSDWNWPNATPGEGSAIFIHSWRKPRHPTEGCIAFCPADLGWITALLTPKTRVFVQE